MRRLKIAHSAAEMESLRPAWQKMCPPDASMFQRFSWNALAARAFSDRQSPFVVFSEDDNGAALVPASLAWRERELGLLGENMFDYRDVLSTGDGKALRVALSELARLDVPWNVTAIAAPASPPWNGLPHEPFSVAPRLFCESTSPQEFEREHSRLASRLRRFLARENAKLVRRTGFDSQFVKALYESKAAQPSGGLFQDRARLKFMVEICRIEGPRCEIFSYEQETRVVAALVTFRDQNFRRFYTTYFDTAYAAYSPGLLLLFDVCRRNLEQGIDSDFMTGDQPFKRRIANATLPLFTVKAGSAHLKAYSGMENEAAVIAA
jgi:CelD/BcsL family acetyltransferase involved in cellulose biosynthesis